MSERTYNVRWSRPDCTEGEQVCHDLTAKVAFARLMDGVKYGPIVVHDIEPVRDLASPMEAER